MDNIFARHEVNLLFQHWKLLIIIVFEDFEQN